LQGLLAAVRAHPADVPKTHYIAPPRWSGQSAGTNNRHGTAKMIRAYRSEGPNSLIANLEDWRSRKPSKDVFIRM
jgi:hypothetical protein